MRIKTIFIRVLLFLTAMLGAFSVGGHAGAVETRTLVVTSDTILSGMAGALLPPDRYRIEAILPPGQCPGHYDVKLSDIEKMQKAALVISFRSLPFMEKAKTDTPRRLKIDNGGRNWMAPDSYIFGLDRLAQELIGVFPDERKEIEIRKEATVRHVREEARMLKDMALTAGISGSAVLSSSMQKEPLEWMGFRVVGVYGRPEALSVREVSRLLRLGKEKRIVAVVDNLQSGPDAGKSIAETLGKPHIVLNNFPSESGYLTTLRKNVEAVLKALEHP
ncbi:MAG TPA: zinc ABC transporter substrate-binding protein [Smithellaceae bacterium]|nr:zinc ABC transporter substrate-binding protein [Smithellaceae bacterium]